MMSRLNNVMPYNRNSFQALVSFVENAEIYVSFFGSRVVYVPGTKETIKLDILTQKISDLARSRQNLTSEEKQMGRTIRSRIWNLYNKSERQLEKALWITRLFERIQEFFKPKGCTMYGCIIDIPSFND